MYKYFGTFFGENLLFNVSCQFNRDTKKKTLTTPHGQAALHLINLNNYYEKTT